MMPRVASSCFVVTTIVGTLIGCSPSAKASDTAAAAASTPGAAGSTDWTANGATACAKYLTPGVVGAIMVAPTGHAKQYSASSCGYISDTTGGITIGLSIKDVAVFRQEMKMIAGTNPLSGVGDAAYWNEGGAISAVKAPNRECDASALAVGAATKVKGAELGAKLGAICNKLFALP